VILVIAVLYGLYYIGTHNQPATPGQQPVQGQPVQGQPGVPYQQGAPAQPGFAPSQGAPAQPGFAPSQGTPAQPGANGALVQQQQFAGRWDPVNGNIQISQAQWRNNANVVMQSATLQCVQYGADGSVITQTQTTLNGPVQPGATTSLGTFQMGTMAQNLAKVNCGIVDVTPANQ
jgi:hypothetical protein